MKLIELMPLNRPEQKKVNEIIDISTGDSGVIVGVDDYDDIMFDGRKVGLQPNALRTFIDSLSGTKFFKELVIRAAKRKVRLIRVEPGSNRIHFTES
jgi:hypothetical protein